jgi:hypothetical protein
MNNLLNIKKSLDKTKVLSYIIVVTRQSDWRMSMANLVFYEGWTDTLQALSKIKDIQFAKDAAWEIINYGTKGIYTTDDKDLIDFVDGMCAIQIDKSQKRYAACKENGSQGGRPQKVTKESVKELSDKGLSKQQIAETLKCSIRSVERKLAEVEIDDDDI